ncbi:MAG: GNAT family N-acetyltransferase [Oscillospiraceae bacterium]|nr:GNAT family N-acetyltransferase [Oscillospiraceae bacterium]
MKRKISIRRMTEDDLGPLHGLLSDPLVMRYLEPPYTEEQTAAFLKKAGLSEPPLIYAAEEDGSFIGYVICHDFDETGTVIGWVLRPDRWNRGCASLLTEQLIGRVLPEGREPVIECSPEQEVTEHIARKYGFTCEGTSGGLRVFRLKRRTGAGG